MYEWKINDEQRIALGFSKLAFAVIDQDMMQFRAKSMSAFVCRVFESYYGSASASIARTLSRMEEDLSQSLHSVPPQTVRTVVDILVARKRDTLKREHTAGVRGEHTRSLRLHNKTLDLLRECMHTEAAYYRTMGAYVRAVVEEYCRLPYIQRERIYFKDRFDLIENAAKLGRKLRVTIQDGRKFIVYPQMAQTGADSDQSDCRSIETDRLNTAHYLVGYSRTPDQRKKDKIAASFRIVSLMDVEMDDETSSIGEDDRKKLADLIKKRSVEFLLHEPTEIQVRLTPNGVYRLSRISHLRPRCIRQDGDIYTFESTQMQAEFYFIRMGEDCEILAPRSLRERFAEIYAAAAEIYRK